MPAFSWTLVPTPTTTPVVGPATGSALLPSPVPVFSQQDFLDLFSRLLPPQYLQPLKDPGPGYEALQAFASVAARVALALRRLGQQAFVLSATAGAHATGVVEIYRPAPNAEGISVTVKAGTVLSASRNGRKFVTTADVTFAAAELGPKQVAVRSVAQSYDYNLPGAVLAADGGLLEGDIDTIDTLVESPELGDTSFRAQQMATATTGGVDGSLDQHGLDRNMPRVVGESDDAFRARIRALPDNISIAAIERALTRLQLGLPLAIQLIETWDVQYQTCWDAPAEAIDGSNFDPDLFAFDDTRAGFGWRNRWLDETDYRGAFIVVVSNLPAISDVGCVWDDTAAVPGELLTACGSRAVSAWDAPSGVLSVTRGGYDGFDLRKQAVYKGIWDNMQAIKAAGVYVAVELESE